MMKRTIKELERRIAFTLARSFHKIEFYAWTPSTDGFTTTLSVNIADPNTILIVLNYKGSALVKLDRELYWTLDSYHKYIRVPTGKHELLAEFTPFQIFGEKTDIAFGVPIIAVRDEKIYRFWITCSMVLDLAKQTNDNELAQDLLSLLSQSLKEAYFESLTKNQLVLASYLTNLFPTELLGVIPDSDTNDLNKLGYQYEELDSPKWRQGLTTITNGLSELVKKYGKRGEILGIAHGHIDTAWLWHFDETKRKVSRTFSVVNTLMQTFHFHYIQSMALYYEWTKDNQPELFQKIKDQVRRGVWELGIGWVENDANMLSGESFARQFLYSQRFYKNEFKKLAKIYWLPDTFGFAGSIPQIAKLGGAKIFATQKVFWNDTNNFPYSVFGWIGIDGTTLPTIAFGHAKDGYNSTFAINEIIDQWNAWTNKEIPMLYSFGYGDGGGGPTEEMLIRAEIVNKLPILPKVKLDSSNDSVKTYLERSYSNILSPSFFNERSKWRGELYGEFHRGVSTSHTKIKHLNRRAEVALREAEIWSTIQAKESKSPSSCRDELTSLWKILLKHQFHDIVSGSAINEVYRTAYEELESVIAHADEISNDSMNKLAQGGVAIFNSLPWVREEYITTQEEMNNSQKVQDGYLSKVRVPSCGYSLINGSIIQTPDAKVSVQESSQQILIENKFLIITIDGTDGSISSIFDKTAERQVLNKKSNIFTFYENVPGWADAWDIEKGYETTSFEVLSSQQKPIIIEQGPLRARIKLAVRKFRNSLLDQEIIVYADSRRIDFKTRVEMHDRELLLKVWFHFNVNSDRATYEIPFGTIERKVTTNTSWEKAMFEVPMQRWLDFSERDYGISILNDGRYGISAQHGSFGISVVRTPIYPDYATDSESSSFIFSIYPHEKSWNLAETPRRAAELNIPVRVPLGTLGNTQVRSKSFLEIDSSNLMLEGIKQAEDGTEMILRLCEIENKRGRSKLVFPNKIRTAKCIDILELNGVENQIHISENTMTISYHNYEIITLKVDFK